MNIAGDPKERFTLYCFSKNFQSVISDLLKGQQPKPENLQQALLLMEYMKLITASEIPQDADSWDSLSQALLDRARETVESHRDDPFWLPIL